MNEQPFIDTLLADAARFHVEKLFVCTSEPTPNDECGMMQKFLRGV